MRLNLVRHPESPLTYPNPLHQWEASNVCNCAVTQHNGLFHMHYRAHRLHGQHRGHALDGTGWLTPILSPHNGREDYRGVEDLRVMPVLSKNLVKPGFPYAASR